MAPNNNACEKPGVEFELGASNILITVRPLNVL
jgi:hypothetical protein